jgi:hypothetical protein
VAEAIVSAVGGDAFMSYAMARDARSASAKAADPNAFLAKARAALAPLLQR